MTLQTRVGIAVMALSLSTGGGGALLVKWAHAMAAPPEPERRALIGTVVEILAEGCGTRNRSTCYRPVVSYTDAAANGGPPQQLVSRTRYRPSPHQKGERVTVYIDATGTRWLSREWDARQEERKREHEKARDFPLVMGWMLILCAAFGLLLGLGLIFWVDRSGERPA